MHALVAEAEHWTEKSEIVGSISLFKVNFLLKIFLLWFEKVFDVNQLQQLVPNVNTDVNVRCTHFKRTIIK